MTYTCSECGRPIQYGSESAYTDEDGNLFCDQMCACDYHGIDTADWDDFEDDSECARRVQRGVNLIDLGGITVKERYLDLVVELLGLPNQILVGIGDGTVSVKTDDGKFAIIVAWVD